MKDREDLKSQSKRPSLGPNSGSDYDSGREQDPKQAKTRFLMIAAVRLGGAIMVMLGLLGVKGALPIPDIAGYLLIGLGLFEVFVMPLFLARKFRSPKQ